MKLYDYYRSSCCYRVRIALNLKAISYEKIPIHLVEGMQHHPEYEILNPQALVPTLVDNNTILTQSLAIIEYLDECYPEPALLPHTPLARATARRLAFIIACDIHPINNLRICHILRETWHASDDEIQTWYHHWLKLGFDA